MGGKIIKHFYEEGSARHVLSEDISDSHSLPSVEKGYSAARDFFAAANGEKEGRFVGLGPWKRHRSRPLGHCDPVLQTALVEHATREDRDGGVHPVLDLNNRSIGNDSYQQ